MSHLTPVPATPADLPKLMQRLDAAAPCLTPPLRLKLASVPLSGADPWTLTSPLTDAERSSLSRRKSVLDAVLAAAFDDEIRRALAPIWLAFQSAPVDPDVGAARIGVYVKALIGLPLFAIERAVDDFVSGVVERTNRAFMPTPAELADRARGHRVGYQMQRYECHKMLTAAVDPGPPTLETEERRKRVAEILGRFAAPAQEAAE